MSCANLERWQWRDPADVAERLEAQSCHGCAFVSRVQIAGSSVESCSKGRRAGRKCRHYVEGESSCRLIPRN